MDSLIEYLKNNGNNEIKTLYNNLKSKGNLQLQKFNSNSEFIFTSNMIHIYRAINIYVNLNSFKRRIILRNINYLNKKFINLELSNNISFKYKFSNNNEVRKLILLFHLILYHIQIVLQNSKDIHSELKCKIIKQLYNLNSIVSTFIPKFYLDNIINIDDLEILLKMFILFSINNYDNFDIKENNDIENIMYLKECLKIIKIIYSNNSSLEEEKLLTTILNYINNNICYIDKNNSYLNYTNKFYMNKNDHNTTKLLDLMAIIHKINNPKLNDIYFELLSNIYFFQFEYNNFNWPFYKMLEPLLINIDKKNYSSILKEISFPEYQLNFITYLINKEKTFISKNPCIFKNGFYFGEKNNNGIIAEIGKIEDNFILTFGFKLVIRNKEMAQNEYIIMQFKNLNNNKINFKICLQKKVNDYDIVLIDNQKNQKNVFNIIPYNYYIFSLEKKGSNLNAAVRLDSDEAIIFDIKKVNIKIGDSILCVGCDIEKNKDYNKKKSIKNNFIYKNKYTGFIGDIFIINTKSFNDKNDNNNIDFYLQKNILNLQGKYGYTIVKSIMDQKNLDEYIISFIEETTKNISNQEEQDFFKTYIYKNNKKDYIMIDNIALLINSQNFKLVDYIDNVDYLNYDNYYYKKEKYLNQSKKEYQFYNNFRIKRNAIENKIIIINTNLFNCNFNIFENKSGLLKLIEEDWIFYLILILEYYYQILFKINDDISKSNENNINKILSDEQKNILDHIENGLENILNFFFVKIIKSYFKIKKYKITIFYYQISVIIKKFMSIREINNKIYDLWIYFLETYHTLVKKCIILKKEKESINNYIQIRKFFLDLLLNENLYQQNENINLLNNLKNLFEILNKIIEDNCENIEIFQKEKYEKLLFFIFIFQIKDFKDKNDISLFEIVKKEYVILLINFIKNYYSISDNKNDIISIFCKVIEENENNPIIFFYLSFVLNESEIIIDIKDDFIKKLKNRFNNNYLENNNNSKILSISSLLLLSGYYMINQVEDSEKIMEFKKYLNDLNSEKNKIIIVDYLLHILNIIFKGINEISKIIFNNFPKLQYEENKDDIEINQTMEKYFNLFLKLIFSLIQEKHQNNNNSYVISKDIINLFYRNFKDILLKLLKMKDKKLFKNIFASEHICLDLFYYKLISSNKKEMLLVENDLIQCCKELITYHNYPFVFKLIELLNENIKNTKNGSNDEIENQKEAIINNDKRNDIQDEENKNNYLYFLIINLIKSINEKLQDHKLDLNNKKQSKYYIRGILNLLIIIHNICEMRDKFYSKNEIFKNIFTELVQLIDKLYLIYSNYCIKIDDIHGKIISELILDSFLFIILEDYDKQLCDLFNKIFLKENKKHKQYVSLFFLIDLLNIPNPEKIVKNDIGKYIDDSSKIKKMNNLLKTKKKYNLNIFQNITNLPNYKCIISIKKINFCIFFLGKISIFLNESNKITNKKFNNYLSNLFILTLDQNIWKFKTHFKNYYDEEFLNNCKLYQNIKEFYDNKVLESSENFESLKELLIKILPVKIKSHFDFNLYYSSLFIWKETEYENINNQSKSRKSSSSLVDEIKNINIIDDKSQQDLFLSDKKNKKGENLQINEKSYRIVQNYKKDNIILDLDDVRNKCFIYNPKNMLIKRIFAHIYYNLLFYDKAFMYIKNKYLNLFPDSNINTKQLNYPSKMKNFSNFYEPKLFLKKDFNFFDKIYFKISHEYLFKKACNIKELIDPLMERQFNSLLKAKLSLVNFYEHSFNIKDEILGNNKEFDCELVTVQYVYFGRIIFGQDYLYFKTKDEFPIIYDQKNKEKDFDLDSFLNYCFSIRNKDNSTKKKKILILFYTDFKLIIKRRALLMYQSLEFFCQNGKSYLFNFFLKEKCESAIKILNRINDSFDDKDKYEIINENISEKIKIINNDVKNRIIDNYLYLSKINFYSSRTFNDCGQYPIFPWIILDFSKLNNLLNKVIKSIGQADETNDNNQEQNIEIENKLDDENKETNQILYDECGLRIFGFPLSMQSEKTRRHSILKYKEEFEEGESNFVSHHGTHYSTSSYVYFFLMRNNPFTQCLIKLQNYTRENPNRLFLSFPETLQVFKNLPENRELIPDLFCHFDFYCNLNCAFNGYKTAGNLLVDDLNNNYQMKYSDNMNSIYANFIYLFRKLLNSNLISKYFPNWLDNIFGRKQIPDNNKKKEESCNIFNKYTYEDKIKLDKKFIKLREKYNKKLIKKYELADRIKLKIDLINNFGVTPHKILDSTIKLPTSTEFNNSSNNNISFKINKNICFIKYDEQILILFNDGKEFNKIKKIFSWNSNNSFKEKKQEKSYKKASYPCGYIKQLKKKEFRDIKNNRHKIPIFKPCYSMSSFFLFNKLFIVTCRYLGNIFKIQNNEYYLDVLCEDFVTCIICRENKQSSFENILIYTGLKNGKLIEWYIKPKLNDYKKLNINEKKNCHCHKGEITCIELYQNQNIIITGGEDKMIFIRKTYDFELLTIINLLYLYCNPNFGKNLNIVPTLIKVSELNYIYILIYNYETEKSFIRGYNLNGLFFGQSEENDFMNICFTKNGSLLTSFYNQDKIVVLNCNDFKLNDFDLNISDFFKNNNKNKNKEELNDNFFVWFNYNYKNKVFILLFEELILKGFIQDIDKQIKLEFY